MDYVYHGSRFSPEIIGTRVERRISDHGKNWVYASKNKSVCLIFAGKGTNYDYKIVGDGVKNPLTIYERYPNAIKDNYDMEAYIYKLNASNFKAHQTEWEPEVVSDKDEHVLEYEHISNLYDELLHKKDIKIYSYEERIKNHELGIYFDNEPPIDNSDLLNSIEENIIQKQKIGLIELLNSYPNKDEIIKKDYYEIVINTVVVLIKKYPLLKNQLINIIDKYYGLSYCDKKAFCRLKEL